MANRAPLRYVSGFNHLRIFSGWSGLAVLLKFWLGVRISLVLDRWGLSPERLRRFKGVPTNRAVAGLMG